MLPRPHHRLFHSLLCTPDNSVNGCPTCAWPWLLNETARVGWGFDGHVTGDCGAARDVYSKCQDQNCSGGHHFAKTPVEAVKDVLTAGMDSDCGNMVSPNRTMAALSAGLITEDLIDTRITNLFKTHFKLGLFDPPTKLDDIDNSSVCSDYSIGLAREGVSESVALIKSMAKTLPLDPKKLSGAAVIGPMLAPKVINGFAGCYGPLVTCGMIPFHPGGSDWQFPIGPPDLVAAIKTHVKTVDNCTGIESPFQETTTRR